MTRRHIVIRHIRERLFIKLNACADRCVFKRKACAARLHFLLFFRLPGISGFLVFSKKSRNALIPRFFHITLFVHHRSPCRLDRARFMGRRPQCRSSRGIQARKPVPGQRRGPCPGYQVDHVTPLCANGRDAPDNMQWITVEAHRTKTRDDVRACSLLRREARR